MIFIRRNIKVKPNFKIAFLGFVMIHSIYGVVQAQSPITLGKGLTTSGTAFVAPSQNYFHGRTLYTKAEINQAGITSGKNVVGFGWFIEVAGDYPMQNFELRMWNTSQTSTQVYEPTPMDGTSKIDPVYSRASYFANKTGQFDTLWLDVPFAWDGSSNIMVEICYTSTNIGVNGQARVYNNNPAYMQSGLGRNDLDVCDVAPTATNWAKLQCVMVFCCFERDAQIVKVLNPVSERVFPEGNNPVQVLIRNNGNNNLSSLKIDWKVNGLPQAAFNWTGDLKQGEISDTITIGTFDFWVDSPLYSLEVIISNPNGLSDQVTFTDTIRYKNLSPGMSGVYRIGGPDSLGYDYIDLKSAVNRVQVAGLYDTTIFVLKDSIYAIQQSFPRFNLYDTDKYLIITSESGNRDSLTFFRNASTFMSNYYIFEFNGANNIIIKDVSFVTTGSGYMRIFEFENSCSNIRIENCNMETYSTASGTEIIYVAAGGGSNITVMNSRFLGGVQGIFINSSSTKNAIQDLMVTECTFINQGTDAIRAQYLMNLDFSNNLIWNSLSGSGNFQAIRLANCQSDTDKINKICNNMVDLVRSHGSSIEISNSSGLDIIHNSLRYRNNAASTRSIKLTGTNSRIRIFNNIISSEKEGVSIAIETGTTNVTSDYNCFYNFGSVFGVWGNTSIPGLSEWRTASNLDKNSIYGLVKFAADTNLHTFDNTVDGKALYLMDYPVDLDGDFRDSITPDIGADEFLVGIDGALTGFLLSGIVRDTVETEKRYSMEFVVANAGSDTLDTLDIQIFINSNLAIRDTDSIGLAPFMDLKYIMPDSFSTNTEGVINVLGILHIGGDHKPINDTLRRSFYVRKPSVIGLNNRYYSSEGVIISPNPSNGNVKVNYNGMFNDLDSREVSLIVRDASGRNVHSEVYSVFNQDYSIDLRLNELDRGLYFISGRIVDGKKVVLFSEKLVLE